VSLEQLVIGIVNKISHNYAALTRPGAKNHLLVAYFFSKNYSD